MRTRVSVKVRVRVRARIRLRARISVKVRVRVSIRARVSIRVRVRFRVRVGVRVRITVNSVVCTSVGFSQLFTYPKFQYVFKPGSVSCILAPQVLQNEHWGFWPEGSHSVLVSNVVLVFFNC